MLCFIMPNRLYRNLSKKFVHSSSFIQNQKRAVLKAFVEPRELSNDDNRQIAIHVLLHLGLIVATVLLFVLPSDSGKEEEGGEQPANEVPVIAKFVEDENGKGKKKN